MSRPIEMLAVGLMTLATVQPHTASASAVVSTSTSNFHWNRYANAMRPTIGCRRTRVGCWFGWFLNCLSPLLLLYSWLELMKPLSPCQMNRNWSFRMLLRSIDVHDLINTLWLLLVNVVTNLAEQINSILLWCCGRRICKQKKREINQGNCRISLRIFIEY